MSCQCHQIGGPFIAEDPDCPAHGLRAQERKARIEDLARLAETETSFIALREYIREIHALVGEF